MALTSPTPLPTRSHEAYVELKRRVISLDLSPGALITEGELASELGLSKTPVREALARLQRDGLVVPVARTGYRVAPVTLKDARDLFDLRGVLEGESAALAARRADDLEGLRRLDELCNTTYDAGDRASISAFLGVNSEFHLGVARATGNDRLVEMLRYVIEQLQRFFHLALSMTARSDEMRHEHHDLVAAIMARDSEAARSIAIAQTRTAQTMVFDALLDCEAVQLANLGQNGHVPTNGARS